ncbi:MAG: hypothetical protein HY300_02790, partial [Verrucomicrobia bacterium]|nr:hypothetical protein [Verrucomicrobiota bacterium]
KPVYMYELTWTMPAGDGKLGSPHLLDLPLVFQNVEIARGMLGQGTAPVTLSDRMAAAWALWKIDGQKEVALAVFSDATNRVSEEVRQLARQRLKEITGEESARKSGE